MKKLDLSYFYYRTNFYYNTIGREGKKYRLLSFLIDFLFGIRYKIPICCIIQFCYESDIKGIKCIAYYRYTTQFGYDWEEDVCYRNSKLHKYERANNIKYVPCNKHMRLLFNSVSLQNKRGE